MAWALKSVHGGCVRSGYTCSAFGAVMCSNTGRMVAAGHTSLRGLVSWVVVEHRWRFRDDLGSEAHIHALVVGDTVLDVVPGATRRIEPRQALWLQHGRPIPHPERLIALQGSRQRGGGEVREKGGYTGRELGSTVRRDPLLRAIHGARHAQQTLRITGHALPRRVE